MQLTPTHLTQRGAGLIEVLIAVLILAIGLLGFAGLQTQAMRVNYEALQRARASAMAEDLFDRMRANIDQALSTENYLRDVGDDKPIVSKQCDSVACSAAEMARWDLNKWLTRLETQMPGADAAVMRSSGVVTVTLRLQEASDAKLLGEELDDLTEDALLSQQTTDFVFLAIL